VVRDIEKAKNNGKRKIFSNLHNTLEIGQGKLVLSEKSGLGEPMGKCVPRKLEKD